jgi:NADPH:quinone reductase
MRFIDFKVGCSAQELFINETDVPEIKIGQVLVKVAAFGINRADLLQRQGLYPAPVGESDILGLEMAGEIVQISPELTHLSDLKIGDKVFGLVAGGAYAEYVAVDIRHVIAQPENLSAIQAAGLAECFLTAYQAMFVEYELVSNSQVLIHAGASGVGLAAIQLAKKLNCYVAVTASGAAKLAVCQATGADLLINYLESDFVSVMKNYSKPNLIIDFIGADYVNRNLSVIAQDGCIIQLAMLGGRKADHIDLALLLGKRVTLKGSTLRNRSADYKAHLVQSFKQKFGQQLVKQEISANIDRHYFIDAVGQAHLRMENNLNSGKLVCFW